MTISLIFIPAIVLILMLTYMIGKANGEDKTNKEWKIWAVKYGHAYYDECGNWIPHDRRDKVDS